LKCDITETVRIGRKTEYFLKKKSYSLRVSQAETMLTVYRSPSRKDAASASWLCSDRACICKTRRVFDEAGDVYKAKLRVNVEKSIYIDIMASI
jgi:hypothetical protein